MKKKIEPPKPLTLATVAGVLADVAELLELDAKSYAREYAPDISVRNETLLRIYTDSAKVKHAKRILSQLAELIEKQIGGE